MPHIAQNTQPTSPSRVRAGTHNSPVVSRMRRAIACTALATASVFCAPAFAQEGASGSSRDAYAALNNLKSRDEVQRVRALAYFVDTKVDLTNLLEKAFASDSPAQVKAALAIVSVRAEYAKLASLESRLDSEDESVADAAQATIRAGGINVISLTYKSISEAGLALSTQAARRLDYEARFAVAKQLADRKSVV